MKRKRPSHNKHDTCPICGGIKDVRAKKCANCYQNSGPRTTMEQRFWVRVNKAGPNGCWLWTGAHNRHGYGTLCNPGHNTGYVMAHRFSWSLVNGLIPDGMAICHHCDNPRCVNPAHLFLGTIADNNQDRHLKGRDGRAPGDANGLHRHPEKIIRGMAHYEARFTDDDIRAIRALKPAKNVWKAAAEVGKQYGRSPNYIVKIWYGYKWKHI